MTTNGRDHFRHLGPYSEFAACPWCGDWLKQGSIHTCPAMNDEPQRPDIPAWLDKWVRRAAFALVIFAAVYLTAHVLVAAGVACRTGG